MRVLFMDDNNERHKKFRQKTIGLVVDWTYNADDTIALLKQSVEYDVIFLDHDLGGPESEGRLDSIKDGRYLARWMVKFGEFYKAKTIIIHSLNFVAAYEMRNLLLDAGFASVLHVPTAWTKFHWKKVGENYEIGFDDKQEPTPEEISICHEDCPYSQEFAEYKKSNDTPTGDSSNSQN